VLGAAAAAASRPGNFGAGVHLFSPAILEASMYTCAASKKTNGGVAPVPVSKSGPDEASFNSTLAGPAPPSESRPGGWL